MIVSITKAASKNYYKTTWISATICYLDLLSKLLWQVYRTVGPLRNASLAPLTHH